MIYLDSYGAVLALDTATSEGLAAWDRLETQFRRDSAPLPLPTRPLRVNVGEGLAPRFARKPLICKNVAVHCDTQRLADDLQGEISRLGS